MTLSVTNQFQRKQIIESAKVNTNFNDIVAYVNDLEAGITDGTAIPDGSITTAKIANNAITNDKMADLAIGTTELAASAVTTAKIADDAVDADKLKDDASTDANRAVTTNHIRDTAVTNAKLATNAVTAGKIQDASVTDSKLSISGCRLDWTYAGTSVDPGATNNNYTWNPVSVTATFDRNMTFASNAFTVPTTGLYVYGGRISFSCDDLHGADLILSLGGSRTVSLGSATVSLDQYYYFGGTVYLIAAESYSLVFQGDCTAGTHNPNFYKIRGEIFIQYKP